MAKHTPGPWKVTQISDAFFVDPVHSKDHPFAGTIRGPQITRAYSEEDARLIAAAPDLLEVVKDLLTNPDAFRDGYSKIIDLVSKIEGRE